MTENVVLWETDSWVLDHKSFFFSQFIIYVRTSINFQICGTNNLKDNYIFVDALICEVQSNSVL